MRKKFVDIYFIFYVCYCYFVPLLIIHRNTHSQVFGKSNHSIPIGEIVYNYFHQLYPKSFRLFSLQRINVFRVCNFTSYYVDFTIDTRKCKLHYSVFNFDNKKINI